MIKTLTLRNFRKHADLTLGFTPGLNALRGASEGGKSTVLEGILYALYGSRSLRTSLADAVTWGHREQDLRATLVIGNYTFERSKAGATVYVGEGTSGQVHVTGQNEVSAFAADLLGADAKTAGMLMLATQSDLRGSLSEGPTAVSGLIGKLADFDLIDSLLARAQERLLTGSDVVYKQRLDDAEQGLAAAQAAVPNPDMVPQTAEMRDVAEVLLMDAKREKETALAPLLAAAEAEWTKVQAASAEARSLAAQKDTIRTKVAGLASRRSTLAAQGVRPDPTDIERAAQAVADIVGIEPLSKLYAAFKALPAYPAEHWEGTRDDFEAEVLRNAAVVRDATQASNTLAVQIDQTKRRLITDGKCPTCGHAANSDEHVASHNAGIEGELKALRAQAAANDGALRDAQTYQKALTTVATKALPFLSWSVPQVAVDATTFPPRLMWTAGVPDASSAPSLRAELARLKKLDDDGLRAAGALEGVDEQISGLQAELAALEAVVVEAPDVDAARAKVDAVRAAFDAGVRRVADAQAAFDSLVHQLSDHQAAAQRAMSAVEGLAARVVELRTDIEALAFNNALVTKLKRMKPVITDRLWSIVLTSVSAFFTQMRGEQSVVTKDAQGFKVNGAPVDSLSGSTQDILAIAVRVALSRTFIPHAAFLVLDEPAHGCDVSRTGQVLGFLASAGFSQTILATHDVLSESVADNVLSVGGV